MANNLGAGTVIDQVELCYACNAPHGHVMRTPKSASSLEAAADGCILEYFISTKTV